MNEISCKLLVIGAGPGGYVCAIRAGQLGIDTVIVETGKPRGTCLNIGCIPSKAVIHAAEEFAKIREIAAGGNPIGIGTSEPSLDLGRAVEWKDGIVNRLNSGVTGLLKKSKVKIVSGWATFRDGKTVEVETDTGRQLIRAEFIVIATGSTPVQLPSLPFGGKIISSTEALSLRKMPDSLAVIGGGYIGLELGTAFAKMGAEVTVVEAQTRILPLYDAELTRSVAARLKDLGITVLTDARASGLTSDDHALLVETDAGNRKIEADHVLVTVGRKPAIDGWGLDQIDIDRDGGSIRVDEQCRTSMRGVFAIGDVTGEPMLAHRIMAQGELVAELVAGKNRSWDKRAIPATCFTDPEIVSVGLSPDEARQQNVQVMVGKFPFTANGRAMTLQSEAGFVRVVAHADTHLVLGIQAVGAGVSELSAAFALALEMGARLEDIAGTIHAHPTQSEAFAEAALTALGRALHA